MPIKVFKMNESNYINKNEINEWADKNNFKITDINVCPVSWHINNKYSKIEDMELIITVIYHKKRNRKNKGDINDIK